VATITLNKDDGIFIYEDYLKGRAALRIKELSTAIPSQSIKRNSNSLTEAVLVSDAWYTGRQAAYTAVDAPTFESTAEKRDDDFMGSNISLMIDLIRGRAQVTSRTQKIVNEGITQDSFKAYNLCEQKAFWVDNSDAIILEPTTKQGGVSRAFLLHQAEFAALSATPVATTYSGTGDGTISSTLHPGAAVAETITLTATSATSFTVVGSTTGAMGTLTVGTTFVSDQITIDITAGGTPFVATDEFVITSYAADFTL
jgi:hypothetical protein